MAMISLKNLVAPVSNSVHLASIVFVVLVFGVWRWSGGEVNFVRGGSRAPQNTHSSSTRDSTLNTREVLPSRPDASRSQGQTKGTITVTDAAADDLLGSILSNKGTDHSAAQRKNPPANSKGSNSNSLEDIERSLGIK